MSMTNQYEFKAIPAGQVNIDEALGIVECFVAGVGNKDSVGDIVLPGAFTESLKRRKPRVVWGHDWNHPIGKVLEIYEVGPNDPRLPMKMRKANIGGLFTRVQFNLKSEKGREAFTTVAFYGEEQEWSIGYKTLDAFFDPNRKANMLKEVELYEVSPVLHGANQLTGTISIKSDEQVYDEKGMPLKDPAGGLTAAGRKYFERTEGSKLKPGVKGPADTPEKMRRKGSFLTRFFTNPSGPMRDENGKPTRLALSAAAWGESVPKNMDDASELAAKGRRLLEKYKGMSEKWDTDKDYDSPSTGSPDTEVDDPEYTGPRGEDGGVPARYPSMGRTANLAGALSMRFGGMVRLRSVEENIVVFDLVKEGESETMRVTYHFDGDEFMFGNPQEVRAHTVYIPMDEEREYDEEKNQEDSMFGETDEKLMDALRAIAKQIRIGRPAEDTVKSIVSGIEIKAGRVLSRNNINKLQQAIELLNEVMATGGNMDIDTKVKGEIHMPIAAHDVEDMKMLVDDVCHEYGLQAKAFGDGIVVTGDFTESSETEILSLIEEYAVKIMRPERFDPNAIDGDNDGVVQEGTPFKRPAAPRVNNPADSSKKLLDMVDRMGHVLDEDERKLLRYRATRTLDDAAQKFGMPREKVRQKEAKALAKVREASLTAKPRSSGDVIKQLVNDYGNYITPEDRDILNFRSEHSLDEAAEKFKLSREELRQREARALSLIRRAFNSDEVASPLSLKPPATRSVQSSAMKPEAPKSGKRVQAFLSDVRSLKSDKFDAEREFGDFNRRFQKHTVDGTMGTSDIVGMDRMYDNLKKKARTEGLDTDMFKKMSSKELNDFFEDIAYGKMEPDTRAEFLAMLMADFELGMRKIAKNRDTKGAQAGEPKIEVDKIVGKMRSRMDK